MAYPAIELRPLSGDGMSTEKKRRGKPKQKVDAEMAACSYLAPSHNAANAIQDLNRDTKITFGDEGIRGLDFSALVSGQLMIGACVSCKRG